jgi:hypothetical protein
VVAVAWWLTVCGASWRGSSGLGARKALTNPEPNRRSIASERVTGLPIGSSVHPRHLMLDAEAPAPAGSTMPLGVGPLSPRIYGACRPSVWSPAIRCF